MSHDPNAKGPTAQEKQERKAQQALDGAAARIEYRDAEMATRERTAELRKERLEREAAEGELAKSED